MKTQITTTLAAIALSVLTSTAFASAPDISIELPQPANGAPSHEAPFAPVVHVGETQRYVSDTLGEPDFRLTENGWVYQNVKVTIDGVARPELDNLIVVFNRGKVASIRVAPDHTLDILIADARKTDPDLSRTVAARP